MVGDVHVFGSIALLGGGKGGVVGVGITSRSGSNTEGRYRWTLLTTQIIRILPDLIFFKARLSHYPTVQNSGALS